MNFLLFLQLVIAAFALLTGIAGLLSYKIVAKKAEQEQSAALSQPQILCYSKFFPFLAIILSVAAATVSGYCLNTEFSWIASILAWLALIFGIFFLINYFCWKIQIHPDVFVVIRPFSSMRICKKNDVVGITRGVFSTKLHLDDQYGTTLRLSHLLCGKNEFIAELDDYYSKSKKCNHGIPEIKEPLFRGYVRSPGEFIAVFVIVDLFLVGAACALGLLLYPKDPGNECQWVILSHYSLVWEDSQLNLQTTELRQPFYANHIGNTLSDERLEQVNSALSGNAEVCILVEAKLWEQATAGKSNFIPILEIKSADRERILSNDEIRRGEMQDFYKAFFAFALILVSVIAFEILFFYVISHAPKYPRLFRVLVRSEYRNI